MELLYINQIYIKILHSDLFAYNVVVVLNIQMVKIQVL
jgi:hypothetical protein